MKSSIKIESFGMQDAMLPVIRVRLSEDTEDLRDWTLTSFFQSMGHDSNLLVVKHRGDGYIQDRTGSFKYMELLPIRNGLVDYMVDSKEAGIIIGGNTKELREFLESKDTRSRWPITYTNDGSHITLFEIQRLWHIATAYGRFLEKNGYNDPDRIPGEQISSKGEMRAPQLAENGFIRRNRIDLMTPAEKAIHDATQEVEKLPAHEWLTDAVNLLHKAKEKVADYIESL